MAHVMMSLGGFKFNIDSAAYNELVKSWKWRWQSQARIGQSDLLQCTGKEADSITLNGEISTTFHNVGVMQVGKLAEQGNKMEPQLLTSGVGDVLGYWIMNSLSETNTKFVRGGLPRHQSFTLELSFYGDDLQNA